MPMSEDSVVGVYVSLPAAKRAIRQLKENEFSTHNVSLIATNLEDDDEIHGFVSHGDRSEKDAMVGGGIGGVLGLLAGAAFFWIPGVGPIFLAGPLATALVGTAVGTLVGAMSGWGVPDEKLEEYEQKVKQGKVLIVAHGDSLEVARAERILAETDAEHVDSHYSSSDESPEVDDRPGK